MTQVEGTANFYTKSFIILLNEAFSTNTKAKVGLLLHHAIRIKIVFILRCLP